MPHSVTPKTEDMDTPMATHSQPTNPPAGDEDVTMTDAAPELPVAGQQKPESGTQQSAMKLDDLFDVDDDEFPSSNAPATIEQVDYASMSASDPALLRVFYQRLFPWRIFFQWLNHSPQPSKDFEHRELAFTLSNDAMLRYMSYRTADLLRKDVLRLVPTRIEIGPVYTTNPRERKMNLSGFRPQSKELCFDIDLTDYDDIRTCCDKANICHKCWRFMTMAIKVITAVLRDDFGFKHIMWVYSGRRGVHAWISDKAARVLDDRKRGVIAGYLQVVVGGAQGGKRVNLRRPLHPHIVRSINILKSHFQDDILEDQDPWRESDRAEKLLQSLPDLNLRDALRRKWDASPGRPSALKWQDIDAVARTVASKNKRFDTRALLEAKQDIVLEYTYPRLDINVSKKLNHLLKSPFVIHPGTGRVCVPINMRHIETFDPLGVPTIQNLIREIDEYKGPAVKNDRPIHDWEKTSLKPYIDYFRTHVTIMIKDEPDYKIKREKISQEGGSLW